MTERILTIYMASGEKWFAKDEEADELAGLLHADSIAPITYNTHQDVQVTINRRHVEATLYEIKRVPDTQERNSE